MAATECREFRQQYDEHEVSLMTCMFAGQLRLHAGSRPTRNGRSSAGIATCMTQEVRVCDDFFERLLFSCSCPWPLVRSFGLPSEVDGSESLELSLRIDTHFFRIRLHGRSPGSRWFFQRGPYGWLVDRARRWRQCEVGIGCDALGRSMDSPVRHPTPLAKTGRSFAAVTNDGISLSSGR
jgi:hypothetical protein